MVHQNCKDIALYKNFDNLMILMILEMFFMFFLLLICRIFQTLSESSKAVLTFNGQFKKFALVDTVSNLMRFLTIFI